MTTVETLTGAPETDAHIRRIHPALNVTCQSGGTERAHLWVTITCGTVTLPSLPLCVPRHHVRHSEGEDHEYIAQAFRKGMTLFADRAEQRLKEVQGE